MTRRFTRFDVGSEQLARQLLGQRLVRVIGGERRSGIIVETEAYLGHDDRAAHTFGGRRTQRVESMYLPGGHAYVYFVYGMHSMFNVVAGQVDQGVAVLVRAIEPDEGIASMRVDRPRARRETDLASGPARLTQALAIDRSLDGEDLRNSESVFIERCSDRAIAGAKLGRGPRVGVDYAGECAAWPLRFWIAGNPHVSPAKGSKSGQSRA